MMTALMSDASDGTMDGRMGGMVADGNMMSTAGTGQLATAMATFVNNLAMSRSGVISVTEMQVMMDRLDEGVSRL